MALKYRIVKSGDPKSKHQYGYQYKWSGFLGFLDSWSTPWINYDSEEEATQRVLDDIKSTKEREIDDRNKNKHIIIKVIKP